MPSSNPKISIVMPCYNRTEMLKRSIKSIIDQSFSDFEFIIIDDCSDIQTKNLLRKYEIQDNRIKIFYNTKNRGPTYSFNKGIYYSKGNYIARMDSDDISHKDRLKKQVEFLENNPKVFVVGTGVNIINHEDKVLNKLFFKQTAKELKEALNYSNPIVNSTFMANTKNYPKKLLYLHKIFYPADDYFKWYNLLHSNYLITNINEILLDLRVHKSESSINSRLQGLKTLLIQKFFKLKQMTYSKNLQKNSLNEIDEIKLFFKNLPSFAKPSKIEIFYFEHNNTEEIFKSSYWYFKLFLLLLYIRNFKDIILIYNLLIRTY